MSSPISLIIGLANPGKEYENTRHNAGAWFIEQLSETLNASLRPVKKYPGLHAITEINNQECHLFIPTTFMNLSGQPIQTIAHFYKIKPESILVAHDDLDLPPGIARLKFSGGHGGHNGLRDLISHLNSNDFYRLRIGIGHPGKSKEVVDYVLHPPTKTERSHINNAIQKSLEAMPLIMSGEIQKAMNFLHSNEDEV